MNGRIIANDRIGEGLYRMKLDAGKTLSAKPGQFINVLVSESCVPLLRRPFSIFDASGRTVEIVYKVIGDATKILAEKKPGDKLDFIGPLGNPYPKPETGGRPDRRSARHEDGKPELILLAGGTGAASIHFLAKELKKKKIKYTLIQGARNKTQIVAPAEFKKLGCIFTTDDGTLGRKGFVTDLFGDMLDDGQFQVPETKSQGRTKPQPRNPKPREKTFTVFACGPKPMFKAIKAVADKKINVTVYASFEEYMGCGIGACLSCVVEVKKGDYTEYKRVCKDGTVFNLSDVVF